MTQIAELFALVTVVTNSVAAGVGAWRWWQVVPSPTFWALCRLGQAAAVALALAAGALAVSGHDPVDDLFWIYALLPVLVSYVAEQLRLTAAQTVLDARDLADAQAMGGLDDAGQRSVVLAIVRREIGTMAIAAGALAFLALRAWGTA